MPNFSKLVTLVGDHIFRSLPELSKKVDDDSNDVVDGVDLRQQQDPQWPCLQLIYELFLELIQLEQVKATAFNQSVSEDFITNLLDLFNS